MRGMRVVKLLSLFVIAACLASCSRIAMHPDARSAPAVVSENLYASDFNGAALNPAGRAKIDGIPADSAPAVFVIHVTRATDRNVFVRRARDVKAYAKDRGLAETQVRFDPTYEDEHESLDPAAATACVADDNR